jgi:hypothetical protein
LAPFEGDDLVAPSGQDGDEDVQSQPCEVNVTSEIVVEHSEDSLTELKITTHTEELASEATLNLAVDEVVVNIRADEVTDVSRSSEESSTKNIESTELPLLDLTMQSESVELGDAEDDLEAEAEFRQSLIAVKTDAATSSGNAAENARALAERLRAESENEVEPDADDDCADEPVEPFNFGRTLSVAHVGLARSFLPSPNKKSTFEMSSHTASKFSWSGADEIDEGLDSANLTTVYLDLTEVVSLHCSSNLLVLEGRDSSTLFTGTLKSASTNTKYMVSGDKIFQWIRGAAISGQVVLFVFLDLLLFSPSDGA